MTGNVTTEESSNGNSDTTSPEAATTEDVVAVQDPVKPDLLGDLGGVNVAAENAKNSAVVDVVEKGAVDTQIKEEFTERNGDQQEQQQEQQSEGNKNK